MLKDLNVLLDLKYLLFPILDVLFDFPLLFLESLLILLHEVNFEQVVLLQVRQVVQQRLRSREVDAHVGVLIWGDESLFKVWLRFDAAVSQGEGRVVKLLVILFVNVVHSFFSFEIDATLLGVN